MLVRVFIPWKLANTVIKVLLFCLFAFPGKLVVKHSLTYKCAKFHSKGANQTPVNYNYKERTGAEPPHLDPFSPSQFALRNNLHDPEL